MEETEIDSEKERGSLRVGKTRLNIWRERSGEMDTEKK